MSVFVIELEDRALSLARDGQVLSSAPGTVFDGTSGSQAGANAWRELRTKPRNTSSRHLSAVLRQRSASPRAEALVEAELKARLEAQPAGDADRVWIVSPAGSDAAGLSTILGITRRLGLPVKGIVDSATVTAAASTHNRSAIVLELGLHHSAATAVDIDGEQARRRRSVLSQRGGLIELYQAWLDLASKTMVKRTRFDPLHDASTEQQLFDSLRALNSEVVATGSTTAAVTHGSHRFEVALTRDQFVQAAEPIYRSVTGLLHELRPAGTPVSIVVPRAVAALPGWREQLEELGNCELVTVVDGFAAAATSLLDLPNNPETDESVRLLRRMPLHALTALADRVTRESLGERRTGGPVPSHVLWDGRTYPVHADSLAVGRSPSDSARHLTLPEGLAGVSRRHCTFVHDGEGLLLLDHSSFGTFVNGERVSERVRVHAGDRVRLGEPGVELALIAVADAASTQQT